eukprot:CAMPEP_0114659640 /NCGR_PEP_ID=MMETSP0191-20121206/18257_1 /TAXON_ID=126664 /ORGANISM="Sorites sp." /LENGTH=47 /DNA_ID= /DNA_START= /DNA_END= /DNA_ORIENTATION=
MEDEVAAPDLEELSELFIDPMAAFADPTENKDDDESEEPLNPMPVHW